MRAARGNYPLRLDRGESDATLAHRMGEGLGVRALGEVSKLNLTAIDANALTDLR